MNKKYSVGKGWWNLLDEYIPKFKKVGAKNITYKEKYGTLRIESSNSNNEINNLEEEIIKKSSKICEFCGADGTIIETSSGWLKTLCPECKKKIKEGLFPRFS